MSFFDEDLKINDASLEITKDSSIGTDSFDYVLKTPDLLEKGRITANVDYNFDLSEVRIKISNVSSLIENVGNGTKLLQQVISDAYDRADISEIYGFLIPSDKNNFDKLEHFFLKNGFDVTWKMNSSDSDIQGVVSLRL